MKKYSKILLIVLAIGFFLATPVAAEFKIEEAKINIPFGNLPSTLNSFSIDPCVCSEAEKTSNPVACAKKEQNMCVNIPWIAMYIGEAYRYGVVIGSVLSVIMMMIGGLMYILGGFNQTMISKARGFMTGGVIGIFLLLGSYIMLHLINPNLVELKPLQMEVAKEEALIKVLDCSEAVKQGYTVASSSWDKDAVCGAEIDIKYNGSDPAKQVAGQTCRDYSCGNTGLACISLGKSGYECKSVLVYGKIAKTTPADLLACGYTAQALAGHGYYIDSLKLLTLDTNGLIVSLTSSISLGEKEEEYYIDKNQLVNNNIPDSSPLFLSVVVNGGYFFLPSETYNVSGISKNFQSANNVTTVDFCSVAGVKKVFAVQKQNAGYLYTSFSPLNWGELKKSPTGIRWDINVNKEFFSCTEGEKIDKPQMDCAKYAKYAEKSKLGEQCNSDENCDVKLYCNTNKNECAAKQAKAGAECLAGNSTSCEAGLICSDDNDFTVPTCVLAPPQCNSDANCIGDGWLSGTCESSKFCDCGGLIDADDGCDTANGYICANNSIDALYQGADTCVKK